MKAFRQRNDDYERLKFLKGSILVIEGNISSGKSTLSKNMLRYLNSIGIETELFEEPILQSYLDTFLKDMPKYAFGFQMSMLIERQCLYEKAEAFAEKGGVAILDRSFFGDKVFAILHNEAGNITDTEMIVYEDVFTRMQFRPPTFVLYLEVNPKVNVQRCMRRDRSCETEAYSLDYFSSLNRIYNTIIPQMSPTNGVLRFNWNKDLKPQEFQESMIFVIDEMRKSYYNL